MRARGYIVRISVSQTLAVVAITAFSALAYADLNITPGGWESWDQPDSWGPGGWEGQCGQTSISNIINQYCGIEIPPDQVPDISWECSDLGPGTDPQTYIDCINYIENCGTWGFCGPGLFEYPLDWLDGQVNGAGGGPTGILINPNCGGQMHWVTVVAVTNAGQPNCQVTYLEHGSETTDSCTNFINEWSLTCSVIGVGSIIYGIDPFTSICQITPPDILVDQPPTTPIPGGVTVGCFPGDMPHDIWQRCRDAWGDWVVVDGYIWDTDCNDIWNDPSMAANDWRWQACQDHVVQCINDTNAVCAAMPAPPGGGGGGAGGGAPVAAHPHPVEMAIE